jgi:hypothetical protein
MMHLEGCPMENIFVKLTSGMTLCSKIFDCVMCVLLSYTIALAL